MLLKRRVFVALAVLFLLFARALLGSPTRLIGGASSTPRLAGMAATSHPDREGPRPVARRQRELLPERAVEGVPVRSVAVHVRTQRMLLLARLFVVVMAHAR